jgi:hypothetical protein
MSIDVQTTHRVIKLDVHVLSKTTGVVVTICLCIPKCLKKKVKESEKHRHLYSTSINENIKHT